MTRPSSLLSVLCCFLTACPPSGEPGADPVGPGGSSSGSDPTGNIPTSSSSGETGVVTTGPGSTSTTSTTSTSGGPDGSSTAADESSSGEEISSSEVSGGSLEDCGNGVMDPGEGCDEGYAENKNDGACTLACQPAECGDGLVWAGHETCDHGDANNNTTYNGCTDVCEFGPHCGDGAIQADEECDAGAGNGSGESSPDGVPCGDECRFNAKVVFVTSETYTGKEVDGATGAHEHCTYLAEMAGLDNHNNFKAFISAVGFIPADAEHFAHAEIPYVRPDGIRIADDWEDLVQEGPAHGILIAENGEVYAEWYVWTGTDSDGKMFLPEVTCAGWASSVAKGRLGRTSISPNGAEWTSFSTVSCDLDARLYCFEQ